MSEARGQCSESRQSGANGKENGTQSSCDPGQSPWWRAICEWQWRLCPPSMRDKVMCMRQLAVMLDCGVPLTRAVQVLAHPGVHPQLRAAWYSVLQNIMSGQGIWSALARHNNVFGLFEVSMVRAAERSSCLVPALNQLAGAMEREYKLRCQLSAALQYPLLLLVSTLLGMGAFLVWVLPVFMQSLEVGEDMPLLTRWLMGISNYLHHPYSLIMLILATVLFVALVRRYLKTPQGRYHGQLAVLKLPMAGGLIKKSLIARFCELLALALRSGLNLTLSLEFASDALGNYPLAAAVNNVNGDVKDGYSLGQAFSYAHFFPSTVGRMLSVSEDVGCLDRTLEQISRTMMMQADLAIAQLAQIIEPLLLILIACFMAVTLVAMFLPLYNCFSAM